MNLGSRILLCGAAFAVTLVLGVHWVEDYRERNLVEQSLLMNEIVDAQARAIERRLSRSLLAASVLAIEVSRHELDDLEFDRLAADIIDKFGGITNLQLAPGGVISKIYPLDGHEAALGFDILRSPERRADALRAIENRRLALVGPFELVQGGVGLIGRQPIFVERDGAETFWGFANVLIVLKDVLAAIEINRLVESGYAYQISFTDSRSGQEEIFLQSGMALGEPYYGAQIMLADRNWSLKISRGGVASTQDHVLGYLLAAVLAGMVAGALYLFLRQYEALGLARDRAERASRERNAFLLSMSHEIRTPLTGLLGVIHLLKRTGLNPTQRRYVETASTTGNTLLTVINDLLDISRIDSDDFPLESSGFEIIELIEEVASVASVAAVNQGADLVCDIDDGLPHRVEGDPQRLRQVLNNLLGDAIARVGNGVVVIYAKRVDAQIEIGVSVTPAIAHASAAGAGQVEASPGDASADSEVPKQGMLISRRWIEAMGSELQLDRESDRVLCYRFRLDIDPARSDPYNWNPPEAMRNFSVCVLSPNRARRESLMRTLNHWHIEKVEGYAFDAETDEPPADAEPCDLTIVDQTGSNEKVSEFIGRTRNIAAWRDTRFIQLVPQGLPIDASIADLCLHKPVLQSKLYSALMEMLYRISLDSEFRQEIAESAGNADRPLPGYRLLLAEDNDINKDVALEILEETGASIDVAVNGVEAVEMASSTDYDLILMDIQMPRMDGYEACRQIRALDNHYARVPIIAMTAHAQENDRNKSIEAGMDQHITKPFDPDKLVKMVVDLAQGRKPA